MTQAQRLDYLVKAFLRESGAYACFSDQGDTQEKRRTLRSLMNIRAPGDMEQATLDIQDAYLQQRAREKGIVTLAEIPTLKQAYGASGPLAEVLSLWQGDITRLQVDAIVNAANNQMLGCFRPLHNCIDNCIHTFAGVELRAECDRHMRQLREKYGETYLQPTAVPMLTGAYNLPAKRVIHVVGPIVDGALTPGLEEALADCYRNVLTLCQQAGLKSVAFCCISTGVFAFPNRRAAEIAVKTVGNWLLAHKNDMERVVFNVFRDEDRACYEALLWP